MENSGRAFWAEGTACTEAQCQERVCPVQELKEVLCEQSSESKAQSVNGRRGEVGRGQMSLGLGSLDFILSVMRSH